MTLFSSKPNPQSSGPYLVSDSGSPDSDAVSGKTSQILVAVF